MFDLNSFRAIGRLTSYKHDQRDLLPRRCYASILSEMPCDADPVVVATGCLALFLLHPAAALGRQAPGQVKLD